MDLKIYRVLHIVHSLIKYMNLSFMAELCTARIKFICHFYVQNLKKKLIVYFVEKLIVYFVRNEIISILNNALTQSYSIK